MASFGVGYAMIIIAIIIMSIIIFCIYNTSQNDVVYTTPGAIALPLILCIILGGWGLYIMKSEYNKYAPAEVHERSSAVQHHHRRHYRDPLEEEEDDDELVLEDDADEELKHHDKAAMHKQEKKKQFRRHVRGRR